ncbi:GntR family transcriptional regulator [Yinghuangia seranimata]|uniref:GntR family transcriptional regulator n=1 Tax=Yinghuangia seranimata TaxID=408067 RepID=UPI00248BB532|nr:GntR family transcriptional regulator [Yinghuangia seranimata]MDI2125826.1 GntR family transcriptional regulator [Yinghuangia seranimata]
MPDDTPVATAPDASLRGRAWRGVADTIRAGGYRQGDRLPSERELADRLGVSRSTLRLALHDLERSGFVVRRPGRGGGTFVAAPKVERDLGAFSGLADYIRRQGLEAGARILSVSLAPADARVAAALRLAPDALAVHITRVRLADGEPIALERSRFPAELFPDLAEQALGGSVYELLRDRYGRAPQHAVERIEPVAADHEMAVLLEIPYGTPLLAIERTAYDASGVPVEHADDLFRGDRTRVVVWTTHDHDHRPEGPTP